MAAKDPAHAANDLELQEPQGQQLLDLSGLVNDMEEVARPSHPSGKILVDFWLSKRPSGGLLTRAEIPSREILPLVPNLFMLEPVATNGLDWRYRLVGTDILNRFGAGSPKGRKISERYPPDLASQTAATYRAVTGGLRPHIANGHLLGIGRDFYEIEQVLLPILGPDAKTRWVLGGAFFFN